MVLSFYHELQVQSCQRKQFQSFWALRTYWRLVCASFDGTCFVLYFQLAIFYIDYDKVIRVPYVVKQDLCLKTLTCLNCLNVGKTFNAKTVTIVLPSPWASLLHAAHAFRVTWSVRLGNVTKIRWPRRPGTRHTIVLRWRKQSFSFSNDDGNENVKTTTLLLQHTFLYISLPSLHDYDVRFSHAMFYGGRKFTTANFFLLFLDLCSVFQKFNSRKILLHLRF